MDIILAKFICSIAFLIVAVIGVSIGLLTNVSKHVKKAIAVGHCFAAGSLLSLWTFHILPEQAEEINENKFGFYLSDTLYSYGYFATFIGFFIMISSTYKPIEEDKQLSNLQSISNNKTTVLNEENSDDQKRKNFPWTFLLFGLGISIHSFFEGYAAGNTDSTNQLFITTGALLAHKWIESFLLVLNYPYKKKSITFYVILLVASLSSPIGLFVDSLMEYTPGSVPLIFDSFSSGIILFIIFDILRDALELTSISFINKLLSIITGSSVILCFLLLSSYLEAL